MERFSIALTSVDAFARKISLNFGGNDSHKTLRGGFITVLVYMITLWQSLALVSQLVNQTEPTISTYDVPYNPVEPVDLLQGRQVYIIAGLDKIDPRVGKLTASIRTTTKEKDKELKHEFKDVEIIPCSEIE